MENKSGMSKREWIRLIGDYIYSITVPYTVGRGNAHTRWRCMKCTGKLEHPPEHLSIWDCVAPRLRNATLEASGIIKHGPECVIKEC